MGEWKAEMAGHLLEGRTEDLKHATREALDREIDAKVILSDALMPAMEELGDRFSRGEAFLPDLLLAADTLQGAFDVLGDALVKGAGSGSGTLVIGTVKGDIHDLGKNLVRVMFEGAGFKVIDLGCDVPAERFCQVCRDESADLVGLSSLLTSSMLEMKDVVRMLRETAPDTKVIVGGAPLTQKYADEIGAHGYAPDAPTAVRVGKRILAL